MNYKWYYIRIQLYFKEEYGGYKCCRFLYNRVILSTYLKLTVRKNTPICHHQKSGTKIGGKDLYMDIAAANNISLVE